jgi:hypothetical protein
LNPGNEHFVIGWTNRFSSEAHSTEIAPWIKSDRRDIRHVVKQRHQAKE